jgi:hypothetical protein
MAEMVQLLLKHKADPNFFLLQIASHEVMMLPTSFAGLLGFWAKKAIGNRDVPGGLLLLNLCLSMKQSKRLQRAVAAGQASPNDWTAFLFQVATTIHALLSRNQARKELIEQISTTLPTETTSWSSVASTRAMSMTAPSSRTGTCSTLTTKEK